MSDAVRCSRCNDRGMLAIGQAIQYCLCPLGRQKKAEWLSFPDEDRAPFEKWGRFVPLNRSCTHSLIVVECPTPTLPDLEDLGLAQPSRRGELVSEYAESVLRRSGLSDGPDITKSAK